MDTAYTELELIAAFFNTYDRRLRFEGDIGVEHLQHPQHLYTWLLEHQLITKQDEVTEQVLERALELRSEARKMIVNNEFDHAEHEWKAMNELLSQFAFRIHFNDELAQLYPLHHDGMNGVAKLIVLIFELKRKQMWHRIRVCSAPDCQWVFVDHSRPGTGRWCTMKACGNRAKNKAYRDRNKQL
ncbi:CGNR zinc finger domain-containing protein [Paenibacillus agilis]|uniref:CGNR zinc finger domain-containing protein n=1 Tax=Paenibacillus agilis TaxID=3020863 RepID=A0A559IKB0_9BACL|nr:CGNR zinc finger domain-containing protein [Paenibacillus agilis]TVX88099.1 CGNR zinc finger domain-containing protein [Paenibacillus agilis]